MKRALAVKRILQCHLPLGNAIFFVIYASFLLFRYLLVVNKMLENNTQRGKSKKRVISNPPTFDNLNPPVTVTTSAQYVLNPKPRPAGVPKRVEPIASRYRCAYR